MTINEARRALAQAMSNIWCELRGPNFYDALRLHLDDVVRELSVEQPVDQYATWREHYNAAQRSGDWSDYVRRANAELDAERRYRERPVSAPRRVVETPVKPPKPHVGRKRSGLTHGRR